MNIVQTQNDEIDAKSSAQHVNRRQKVNKIVIKNHRLNTTTKVNKIDDNT